MDRTLDLIIHLGKKTFTFGLCYRFDWFARRTVDVGQTVSLSHELRDFLITGADLYERLGKIVVVTNIAAGLESVIAREVKQIGYIRITQDQYEPEYIMRLLESHGGSLLVENLKPGEMIDRGKGRAIAKRFTSAGIRDIAILSAYQIESSYETRILIDLLDRVAPDAFTYHMLDTSEYQSLLLSENSLLAGLCIKNALAAELHEIQSVCDEMSFSAPILLLSGEGFLTDLTTVLKNPVRTWMSSHAGKLIGAARLLGLSDAVAVTRVSNRIIVDRIKDYHPVAMGRTKQYYGLQIPGPFTGAVEFSGVSRRQRILDAIHTVNTEPGPLPLIDMTGGTLESLELEYEIYHLDSPESAVITGAQCAHYRKDFYGTAPSENQVELLRRSLLEESGRWLESSSIRLKDQTDEFMNIEARYLNSESRQIRLRVTGRIV